MKLREKDLTLSYDNLSPCINTISKRQSNNTKSHQKFDYIAIADRLRTISWRKYSHHTGVVSLVHRQNLQTPGNSCAIKWTYI